MASKKTIDEDEIGTLGVNHGQGTRHGEKKGELLGRTESDTVRKDRLERLRGKSNERRNQVGG